jgi:hypothetical protein
MEGGPRLGWSTIGAVAIHLAALVGLWSARPSSLSTEAGAAEEIPIDLLLDIRELPQSAEPMGPPSGPATPEPAGAVTRVSSSGRVRRQIQNPVAPPPEVPSSVPESAAATDARAGAPSSSAGAMATGDPSASAPPGAGSSGVAAPSAPADEALPPPLFPRPLQAPRAVFESLSGQPYATPGSGAGGQVLGVARAIADADAPRKGRGTISIETDPNGNVTRVRSTSPSWETFAKNLAAKLAGRRLRVPPGAKGVLIRLAVNAEVTTAPAAITGESKAQPCRGPQFERDNAGRQDFRLDMGCQDWSAFTPVERRRVSVSLAGEQTL